jgi:ABC-type oligopeptide transport system substrate-binding subunit
MPREKLGVRAVSDRQFEVEFEAPSLSSTKLVAFAIFNPIREDFYEQEKIGTVRMRGPAI